MIKNINKYDKQKCIVNKYIMLFTQLFCIYTYRFKIYFYVKNIKVNMFPILNFLQTIQIIHS